MLSLFNFNDHLGHGTRKRDRRHHETQDYTHHMEPHAPGGCGSGAPDTAVVFFIPQDDRKQQRGRCYRQGGGDGRQIIKLLRSNGIVRRNNKQW